MQYSSYLSLLSLVGAATVPLYEVVPLSHGLAGRPLRRNAEGSSYLQTRGNESSKEQKATELTQERFEKQKIGPAPKLTKAQVGQNLKPRCTIEMMPSQGRAYDFTMISDSKLLLVQLRMKLEGLKKRKSKPIEAANFNWEQVEEYGTGQFQLKMKLADPDRLTVMTRPRGILQKIEEHQVLQAHEEAKGVARVFSDINPDAQTGANPIAPAIANRVAPAIANLVAPAIANSGAPTAGGDTSPVAHLGPLPKFQRNPDSPTVQTRPLFLEAAHQYCEWHNELAFFVNYDGSSPKLDISPPEYSDQDYAQWLREPAHQPQSRSPPRRKDSSGGEQEGRPSTGTQGGESSRGRRGSQSFRGRREGEPGPST